MNKSDPAEIAAKWWYALQPNFPNGERNPTGDRAALAVLRRAELSVAMSEPATFALFRDLGFESASHLPRVALCAAVLAGVRKDCPNEHPARTLGTPAEQPRLKPLRFRRLIEAEAPEERLIALRRASQLADRALNVRELARACLDWSDDRRREWIFQYYSADRGASDTKAATEETSA
jgi:CRISPR system Cascade subunit CasB